MGMRVASSDRSGSLIVVIEIIADESHKSKNQSLGWPVQYTQAYFS